MTDSNRKIKHILDKQLKNGRLAHAYLFVGPKGTGKKSLAMEFAGKVLGIESRDEASDNLQRHPDYSHFDCLVDGAAESVRDFIGKIALKPFLAKRKFALISNIENLNPQGANALLKTLEEPPPNTVMVLTADTRRVLPTIFSRCQVFSFNRGLMRKLTPKDAEIESASIEDFAGKGLAERLLAISQFADLEEPELKQSIEDFIYESAGKLSSFPEKYTQLAAGLKAFEDLDTNKNRKLILQGLFMRI